MRLKISNTLNKLEKNNNQLSMLNQGKLDSNFGLNQNDQIPLNKNNLGTNNSNDQLLLNQKQLLIHMLFS